MALKTYTIKFVGEEPRAAVVRVEETDARFVCPPALALEMIADVALEASLGARTVVSKIEVKVVSIGTVFSPDAEALRGHFVTEAAQL